MSERMRGVLTPERRARLDALFDTALDLSPAERAALIDAARATDPELHAELELLLAAHDRAELGFLATPVRPSRKPRPRPERIGEYRVLDELGRGGMGIVYLAEREHHRPRRRVAVKVLRDEAHGSLRRRFEVERHALAALDHPNIARLLDGGIDENGRPFLVMEYVAGQPITQYCDARHLPVDDRVRLFCSVVRAVQHAHRNLIVHRDLKPSNILVTDDGVPKLLDFGIAKLLDPQLIDEPIPITTGLRLMTPDYASPEQVAGDRITTASDIYSLGIILCELLTGRRPFPTVAGTPLERERMLLETEPPKPSSLVSISRERADDQDTPEALELRANARGMTPARLQRELRGDLDRIVLMALRTEPERRYRSADQLAEDLEHQLAGMPVLAHGDSGFYRARKFIGRNRAATVAGLVAFLSLAGGAGAAMWQAAEARAERDAARRALAQSQEVRAFLMALFEAGDPDRPSSATVTSRDLLERGLRRINELDREPLVQAQMLGVVGRVLRHLGDLDRAQPLFERALGMRRELRGEHDLEVAESLEDLGALLLQRQRYADSRPLLERSLAIRTSLLGERDSLTGRALTHLAAHHHAVAQYDSAEILYRRALATFGSGIDSPSAAGLSIHYRLAVLMRDRGHDAAADSLLREVLEGQRALLGTFHADVARTLILIGSMHARRGDYAGAEQHLREALEIRRRVFGDEHHEVATTLAMIGSALRFQNRHAEAEQLHQQALEQLRRLVGPDHSDIAASLNSLGLLARARGDLSAADSLYRESLAMYVRVRGSGHPLALTVFRNIARIQLDRNDFIGAEQSYRQVLDARRRSLGPDHPYVASSMNDVAGVLHRQRRYRAAESMYQDVLATFEPKLGASHLYVRNAKRGLADLYQDWGRPDDAARFRVPTTPP